MGSYMLPKSIKLIRLEILQIIGSTNNWMSTNEIIEKLSNEFKEKGRREIHLCSFDKLIISKKSNGTTVRYALSNDGLIIIQNADKIAIREPRKKGKKSNIPAKKTTSPAKQPQKEKLNLSPGANALADLANQVLQNELNIRDFLVSIRRQIDDFLNEG